MRSSSNFLIEYVSYNKRAKQHKNTSFNFKNTSCFILMALLITSQRSCFNLQSGAPRVSISGYLSMREIQFRIVLCLIFKARPRAKPFIGK